MFDTLKALCEIDATSGGEKPVRDYIISRIDGFCDYRVDNLGNILFEKKGNTKADKKIMLDAHMDEVGIIITDIDESGFLRFATVGGIEKECLFFHRVMINGKTPGVISGRPIHLCKGESAKQLPDYDAMYIDIGAVNKQEAQSLVKPGDLGVLTAEYLTEGDKILSKALDDRVGCAVLIELIRNESEYDFCGSFSVCEEVGSVGAKTAAFALDPDYAIILEGTTAADLGGVTPEKQVCVLGDGVAVSFMDRGTVYSRELFDLARSAEGIKSQTKRGTYGGNNAAGVHTSREGVKTLALSVPCRYIHSTSSVCSKADVESMYSLAKYLISAIQKL